MLIDPTQISKRALYGHMTHLITPRPIAWVSTRSSAGCDNLAPFSYFNAVGTAPPMLMFCPANKADGSKKDTLRNVEQTGQFVVNVVSANLAQPMNASAAEFEAETSEFAACGLTPAASRHVAPPRVAEALAAFECELHTVMLLGSGPAGTNLVLGKILAIHVDDRCLDSAGQVDPQIMDSLGRMGGSAYATTRDRFELPRPTR
ncbi:flavin reductase family protein [Planctomycetaceae bacterium SH139]